MPKSRSPKPPKAPPAGGLRRFLPAKSKERLDAARRSGDAATVKRLEAAARGQRTRQQNKRAALEAEATAQLLTNDQTFLRIARQRNPRRSEMELVGTLEEIRGLEALGPNIKRDRVLPNGLTPNQRIPQLYGRLGMHDVFRTDYPFGKSKKMRKGPKRDPELYKVRKRGPGAKPTGKPPKVAKPIRKRVKKRAKKKRRAKTTTRKRRKN